MRNLPQANSGPQRVEQWPRGGGQEQVGRGWAEDTRLQLCKWACSRKAKKSKVNIVPHTPNWLWRYSFYYMCVWGGGNDQFFQVDTNSRDWSDRVTAQCFPPSLRLRSRVCSLCTASVVFKKKNLDDTNEKKYAIFLLTFPIYDS